jgi:hypothetical protein
VPALRHFDTHEIGLHAACNERGHGEMSDVRRAAPASAPQERREHADRSGRCGRRAAHGLADHRIHVELRHAAGVAVTALVYDPFFMRETGHADLVGCWTVFRFISWRVA